MKRLRREELREVKNILERKLVAVVNAAGIHRRLDEKHKVAGNCLQFAFALPPAIDGS